MTFHLLEEVDTPFCADRFIAAFDDQPFILDDAFMGAEPHATFRAWRHGTGARVEMNGQLHEGVDPFAALRTFLSRQRTPLSRAPFAFRAGLVGYIGYECGQILERLPCRPRPSLGMPDIAFGLYRWVLARIDGKTWLSLLADSPDAARAKRDEILTKLGRPHRSPPPPQAAPAFTPALDRDAYLAGVASAKEHIAAGDAFEICLTNTLRTTLDRTHAWRLFEVLRQSNPAPFAAYLELPEGTIVSSSPERFLSLSSAGIAESRPIKGTRPRGATPEADLALAHDLATAEKDRAENTMIVDLVRNDLGRVCRVGTVHVPQLHSVERYATVHHLVSTIRGELAHGNDAIDLIRACFPPGSMTGAPKIEAMKILEHLEPVERGVYAGALGYIDLEGAMDLSVVIRTVVFKDGVATFATGGAVVADSEPVSEWNETQDKIRAIVAALESIA